MRRRSTVGLLGIGSSAGSGVTGSGDAFLSAFTATSNTLWFRSARDISTGNLANGDTVATDLSGNSEPSMVAVLASTGNWSVVDTMPVGDFPSLANAIKMDERGTSNYAVATGATSAGAEAGFYIFRMPTGAIDDWCEVVGYDGTSGAPEPNTNELIAFVNGTNASVNVSGGAGLAPCAHRDAYCPFLFAWRRSSGTTYTYLAMGSGSWAASSSTATAWTAQAGTRYAYQGLGTGLTADGYYLIAEAAWSADPGATVLATMRDTLFGAG